MRRKFDVLRDSSLVVGFLFGVITNQFLDFPALPSLVADCQEEMCTSPPCCNGDANGDKAIDVSDVVRLLTYLFANGPEPEAISCSEESYAVLATGQTKCYHGQGGFIDCNSADWPGQDGSYELGCPMEKRFVDNGDGTLSDSCTGLMWQKATADIDEDGEITGYDDLLWQDALKYCENLDFAGYTDWRLPNVRELESIVDYGQCDVFLSAPLRGKPSGYWSCTTNIGRGTGWVWFVSFGFVGVYSDEISRLYYVRAVRGGL